MRRAKSIKRILVVCAIALLTAFYFPSEQALGQAARPVASPEAQAAAKRLWDNILTTCDDSRSARNSYFYDGRNDGSENWGDLAEFRDVHFYVFPIEVSHAEQLNGLRWHAAAVMIADVYRSAARAKGAWEPFKNGEPLGNVRYDAKALSDGEPLISSKNGNIAFIGSPDALHPQPKGWFVVGMEQRGGSLFYKWAWSDERRSDDIARLKPACSLFPGTREFEAAQSQKQSTAAPTTEKFRSSEDAAEQALKAAAEKTREASAPPAPVVRASGTKTVRVDSAIQAAMLTKKVAPLYPKMAAAAHVQGTVRFEATINTDGKIQNVQLISGPPLLVQAATGAVRQWEYKPTILGGSPVNVSTIVDVDFALQP